MKYEVGQWLVYVPQHCECQVIIYNEYWDQPQYKVWVPFLQMIKWANMSQLQSFESLQDISRECDRITYISAASKLSQVLSLASVGDELLSPVQSNLIPLPHQISALKRVLASYPIRFLLADEVGLGKTIEAGMVLQELKLRGKAKRILLVVPKGLANQWISEMKVHFNEKFRLISGEEISSLDCLFASEGGAWKLFDQVIVSLDSVKPLARRKGWSKQRIEEYNKTRLGNLLKASWDLVIIDEAHRIGGSTDQVARHKLGKALAEVTPNILLLSATPHQGKSDAFARLMNILDHQAFPDSSSVSKKTVYPYIVRTEKRNALDEFGQPLFQPRKTSVIPISWGLKYTRHRELYEAVSEYVRTGYNNALKNKKPQVGFLMVLLQRLVTSSTLAIKTTLERRLDLLKTLGEENLPNDISSVDFDELFEMDGEDQQELLITSSSELFNEISTVETLLEIANRCLHECNDAKIVELQKLISEIEAKEDNHLLKVLVFTEFVATQQMLQNYFEDRNIVVVIINGSRSMEERLVAQRQFQENARILISTDAGGEGLNLQFAHIVVNYDLPWNPMKIEQRIGRVDRIGQKQPVEAYNLLLTDSVEYRVLEVLEKKLQIVASELGIDKTSDVLETGDNARLYQNAIIKAVMKPESSESAIEESLQAIKTETIQERSQGELLYSIQENFSFEDVRKYKESTYPLWIENMVIAYLRYKKGKVTQTSKGWTLVWPDGQVDKGIGFRVTESKTLLSTADSRVLSLIKNLPSTHSEFLIPWVDIPELPKDVDGTWGLFECTISSEQSNETEHYLRIPKQHQMLFPVFISEDEKMFPSTAQRVWSLLAASKGSMYKYLDRQSSEKRYHVLHLNSLNIAIDLVNEYRIELDNSIKAEIKRLVALDLYQQSRIEKTALEKVKNYRQTQLALFKEKINQESQTYRNFNPELRCLLVCRIGGQHV